MDKYYYLISQLPALVFDKNTYMSTELFLEEAQKWMNVRDLSLLYQVNIYETDVNDKLPADIRRFQIHEKKFRTEIAAWRGSQKSGLEYKPTLFPVSLLKEGNPLEVEKKLLYARWHFINEIEGEHHFDLVYLMLYFLKLQILNRLMSYDKQKGMETFQKVSKVTL